jgi:hypothetical protein
MGGLLGSFLLQNLAWIENWFNGRSILQDEQIFENIRTLHYSVKIESCQEKCGLRYENKFYKNEKKFLTKSIFDAILELLIRTKGNIYSKIKS